MPPSALAVDPNDELTTATGICLACGELIQPDTDRCPRGGSAEEVGEIGHVLHPIRWFAIPAAGPYFPVDTLDEALPFLRRPFTKQAVRWKLQSSLSATSGLIVGYIDARLVIERLNHVVGGHWHDQYEATNDQMMICRLQCFDEPPREDVGEGKGKALRSDAFKRAAVKFGIGVSVYAIPKIILEVGEGKGLKKTQKGNLMLTNGGLKLCAEQYDAWLKASGIRDFGEPIDHGDVEDSAGEAPEPEGAVGSDLPAVAPLLVDARADGLRVACREAYERITKLPKGKSRIPKARFDAELAAASKSHDDLEALLASLSATEQELA